MKNTIRVRRNGGKADVSTQPKTSTRAELEENIKQLALEVSRLKFQDREAIFKWRGLAEDLNKHVIASDVLAELMLNRADWEEHRGGTEYTREEKDRWNYGIHTLFSGARKNLIAAKDAIFTAAYGPGVQS